MQRLAATVVLAGLVLLIARPRAVPAGARDVSSVDALDGRVQPIGWYANQSPMPMTPRVVLTDQLHESLRGPAGIAQGGSTDRTAKYWGTDAIEAPSYAQVPLPKANRPQDLEVAAQQAYHRPGPGAAI